MKNIIIALVVGLTYTTVSAGASVCTTADIVIKSSKAAFKRVDGSKALDGIAVLVNKCSEPVGVQVKITAYDKAGEPIATRDLWPASVNNISPGEYPFSLRYYLDYTPEAKTFTITVVSVKRW